MKRKLGTVTVASLLLLAGCAKNQNYPPLVSGVEQRAASVQGLVPAGVKAVETDVTLRRDALLGRTFLYGITLQTSSMKDGDIAVTLMAMNAGQLPAEFRIIDDKLRLVSDARLNFESDVNHPSRLIDEFKIIRQDAATVTIRAKNASPILESFVIDSKNKATKRNSFIRSLEYVEANELFLIESTLEMTDGSVAEVMETLTPRDRVIPEGTKPIYNDEDLNDQAKRFRFLSQDKVFLDVADKGRVQTAAAERFLLKDNEPVRWYASANTPDKYMNDVKNGVEGWNRYSQAMWSRDIVRFEGKVPEGTKIGDPRFNIVVWDQVAEAGAAYESQNSDPFTGVQSNSLVYLPAAWVNIGKDYWKAAARTEEVNEARVAQLKSVLATRKLGGRSVPVNCVEGAHMHVDMKAKLDPEAFGRELLRGTLFHEIGHAMGLAHNFKGSLSFDPDTGKGFSTSIMDYNHFNEESAGAFDGPEVSTGPLLEYDRQMISVLYNEGKDIKDSDATVPACNDEDADSSKDGVDPLCLRYDIGKDPTLQALRSIDLLKDKAARNGLMSSLPNALVASLTELPAADGLAKADDAKKAVSALLESVKGTANLYVGGTANSLANLGSLALKSLHVAREGVLPEGYKEESLRDNALTLLDTASNLEALPEATKLSLTEVRTGLDAYLRKAPAFTEVAEADRDQQIGEILKGLDGSLAKLEQALLSKMRTKLLSALKYNAEAPFAFHVRGTEKIDIEARVLGVLEKAAGTKVASGDRPEAERLEAVKSLLTYKALAEGKAAIERVKACVDGEIRASQDARQRESLRKVRAALEGTAAAT